MKNLIYVRVSTEDQDNQLQIDACVAYCRRLNLEFEIFEDKISGAKTSRPAFDRLMAAVRAGQVERVICYKLDRLGRSLPHLAMVIEEFKTHGVAFVATSQGIDTSANNPMANCQLGMLMVFAEFERALIKERVNAGIKAAKAKGVKFGRKLTHDLTPALVREMKDRGMTFAAIEKATGVNRGTVLRLYRKTV